MRVISIRKHTARSRIGFPGCRFHDRESLRLVGAEGEKVFSYSEAILHLEGTVISEAAFRYELPSIECHHAFLLAAVIPPDRSSIQGVHMTLLLRITMNCPAVNRLVGERDQALRVWNVGNPLY